MKFVAFAVSLLAASNGLALQDDGARPSARGGQIVRLEAPAEAAPTTMLFAPAANGVQVGLADGMKALTFESAVEGACGRAVWSTTTRWQNPDRDGRLETIGVRFTMTPVDGAMVSGRGVAPAAAVFHVRLAFEAEVPLGSGRFIALDELRQTRANGGRVRSEFAGAFSSRAVEPTESAMPTHGPALALERLDDGDALLVLSGAGPFADGFLVAGSPAATEATPFGEFSIDRAAFAAVEAFGADAAGSLTRRIDASLVVAVEVAIQAIVQEKDGAAIASITNAVLLQ